MTEFGLLGAFTVGVLGGVHCVGMCGGIVGALSTGMTDQLRESRWRFVLVQLAYNLGRIGSYTLAGVIAGTFAWHLGETGLLEGFPLGKVVGGIIMILFGIYLTGWWHSLLWLERAGGYLWRYIEPLGRRFMPVRSAGQALMLGMVWGWLPCGMVYAVLALALTSANPLAGGAIMLSFGIGTLPTMLFMGLAFTRYGRLLQARYPHRRRCQRDTAWSVHAACQTGRTRASCPPPGRDRYRANRDASASSALD